MFKSLSLFMTLTNYLKSQLTDFVDAYKIFYTKSLATTIIFSLVVFAIISLLLNFSLFDAVTPKKQISLLSYFFVRYSAGSTYSLVDLSKTMFIFVVSLFAITLTRLKNEKSLNDEYNFSEFLKKIKASDFGFLLVTLVICIVVDYFLFKIDSISAKNYGGSLLDKWINDLLFLFRIYIPLLLFSIAAYKTLSNKTVNLSFKKIIFLFIALWLFNEFAYEFSLFVRTHIFSLIVLPFSSDKRYLIESILGVPLVSFYFLGYYSAMVNSLLILEENQSQ
jgi:hypothetical protein